MLTILSGGAWAVLGILTQGLRQWLGWDPPKGLIPERGAGPEDSDGQGSSGNPLSSGPPGMAASGVCTSFPASEVSQDEQPRRNWQKLMAFYPNLRIIQCHLHRSRRQGLPSFKRGEQAPPLDGRHVKEFADIR